MSNRSLYNVIKCRAQDSAASPAILAPDRSPLSYGQLFEQVQKISRRLNELGVGRNDVVPMVLPNGPEMATAFIAVANSACSAPLNPNYRQSEFEFYLSDLPSKALLISSDLDSPARDVAQSRGIPVIELNAQDDTAAGLFTLSGDAQPVVGNSGFAQPQDAALILHTSGTTSRPKMVALTQTNVCSSAENIGRTLRLTPADRCLNVMPLFHIHGLIGAILSSLTAGASLICTPGFDAVRFFEWLAAYAPTWYSAVPTMHQAVLERAAAIKKQENIASSGILRFVRSSSASLPQQLMADLEHTFGAPVIESYGMTEAAHQMCSNPLPPGQRKPGSVGLPAGPEVAIMDGDNRLLPAGGEGEIVIRGENVTAGYSGNPDANEAAFADGWFRTGDRGRFDEDRYFYITGRIKEMINRGGESIAPREVDEVLLEHPAVAQAVAFAIPHPTLGEDLAAAVVVHTGVTASEAELRGFAFDRLASVKVPSRIVTVSEIPKGPTGKLQRIGLHEALADQLNARYVAPRTDQEQCVAAVIERVLGRGPVGVTDNFFALGGDSIKATRVLAELCSEFQVQLPAVALFRNPTVEELCQEMTHQLAEDAGQFEDLLAEIEGMTDEEIRRQTH